MDHNPTNGHPPVNGVYEPTQADLERELPLVLDDQVPLGDLVSRVVQSIYAELSELAETSVLLLSISILCFYNLCFSECQTCQILLGSVIWQTGWSKRRSKSSNSTLWPNGRGMQTPFRNAW